jgi:cobalamin synthase
VNAEWRRFLAALRFVTHPSGRPASLRYLPLVRIGVGVAGAGTYWLAAQLWPASIAVVLSLLVTALLDARGREGANWYWVFVLLIRYNTLMALSASIGPIHLPANCTLGLIMIAAQAVSGAMEVSAAETGTVRREPSNGRTTFDFTVALGVGLAPATLLGVPGLIGLGTAIVAGMALGRWRDLPALQPVTETCFYLGALAAWQYV